MGKLSEGIEICVVRYFQIIGKNKFEQNVKELRQATDSLRIANKKLNLLSSITRHDIRNQLMALKSYIELSGESMGNSIRLAEFFKKEGMIADNIERQINFTGDYEEMGVNSPAWQNVDAIVNKVASGHHIRKIRIETNCPGREILADPLFEKVFFNLIDNALRYGGQKMTVIRTSLQDSEKGLVISVEDDGAGISDGDKKRLFERGFGKNTGLGLFLSSEILSITGISIRETGEPGKGARFEMTVPKGNYRSVNVKALQER
ncbi:MAG: HAMP domain-containing sensor histidine kinase [Methanoregula sp.]|nr:HAMP domain-containing sensor histidine kinase [Methanoregula sp.]